jgi:hypothetical protein
LASTGADPSFSGMETRVKQKRVKRLRSSTAMLCMRTVGSMMALVAAVGLP